MDGYDPSESNFWNIAPYDPALTEENISRELAPGEVACVMAHLRVWQTVVQFGYERCLVLEDDALLNKEALPQIQAAIESGAHFDLLNLTSDTPEVLEEEFPLLRGHTLTRFVGLANRTSAYVISIRGAEKLIRVALPIAMELDRYTGDASVAGLEIKGIFPPVATLLNVNSEIWGRGNNPPKRVVWKRKVMENPDSNVAVLNPKLFQKKRKISYTTLARFGALCKKLLGKIVTGSR